ncbi:MAG TPA: hypothetical protein PLK94_04020 [Alphaproteobacteria bacterium]|nr:hypothetical protein [Alphaproteobacteria bacterium]HOO50438.1 hypothetical protein [Alphaproteobacteria bacterium]
MTYRILTGLLVSASLTTLSACTPQISNQWVPKGYSYQDSSQITSPIPSSPWIEEAEIKDTNKLADNTAAWQGAVFELVDGLSTVLPTDGTAINIITTAPVTNQDLALDHYVRQALIQKNITLTTTADMGSILNIDSQPLTNQAALDKAKSLDTFTYVEDMDLKGFYLLTASLKDGSGLVVGESASVGVLPHEKAEYSRLPGFSIAPVTGISKEPTPIYERD